MAKNKLKATIQSSLSESEYENEDNDRSSESGLESYESELEEDDENDSDYEREHESSGSESDDLSSDCESENSENQSDTSHSESDASQSEWEGCGAKLEKDNRIDSDVAKDCNGSEIGNDSQSNLNDSKKEGNSENPQGNLNRNGSKFGGKPSAKVARAKVRGAGSAKSKIDSVAITKLLDALSSLLKNA